MPSKRQARIAAIQAIASRRCWALVDRDAFGTLCAAFPGVSDSTLRRDLRECGLPLHPLVEGVRLDSLEDLNRTLLALAALYQAEGEPGADRAAARAEVLAARRKVEWILRNPRVADSVRDAAREKLVWLRVWLENPPLFAPWVTLRLATLRHPRP